MASPGRKKAAANTHVFLHWSAREISNLNTLGNWRSGHQNRTRKDEANC